MPRGIFKYGSALVALLLLLVSASTAAATRFSVSGFGMPDTNSEFVEFGILQYALPSLSHVFTHNVTPPITLTLDNSAGPDAYFQVEAAVYYNNALLTAVTFGRRNAVGGELVLAGEKRVYHFDASGIKTASIVQTMLDDTGEVPLYLGDALQLDVVAGEYRSEVLNPDALEEAVIFRNTLPNGHYLVTVTLKKSDGVGDWVDVAAYTATFTILETLVEPISPVGNQGRFSPEFLEFSVSGFPVQAACLHARAELSAGHELLWRSDVVTVGEGSACQYKAAQGTAYVTMPLPHDGKLIGGIEYAWTAYVTDALSGGVLATRTVRFNMPNTYPEIAIEPLHAGDLVRVRPGDNEQFVARVYDYEDDQLGYDTVLTWLVKSPGGQAPVIRVDNKKALSYTFTQQGRYELELQATDRFGATSTTTLQVLVEENRLPQLTVKAVQFKRSAQTKNVAWSQKGQLVELAKQTYLVGDQLIFTFDVADADGDDVRLVLRNNQTPLFTTTVPGAGTVVAELELSQPITYNLAVDVVDSKAGTQSWRLGEILALPEPTPVVSIVSPTHGGRYTTGTYVTLQAEAYDADDLVPVVEWYRLYEHGPKEKLGTGSSFTYMVGEGAQSVQAQVIAQRPEAGGNNTITGMSSPITLYGHTVPNEKPSVRIIPPAGGLIRNTDQTNGGHTVTLQAEASDFDGPKPLRYTWYVADELIAGSTNRISYTFNGSGVWPIRVEVSDGADTSSAAVAMVVTETSVFALQITDVDGNEPGRQYRQGDVLTLQAEYDADGEVVTAWQLSGATPDNVDITELVALGNPVRIPLERVGDFIMETVAVDAQGRRGSARLELSVQENQPPEVDFVIWPESVYVGDVFQVTVDPAETESDAYIHVSDLEGDAIVDARWYLNGVNVGNGLRFSAAFAHPGTYIYGVNVTDSHDGVGVGGFVIDVVRDLQPPQVTITQPETRVVPLYTPINLQASIYDPEGEERIIDQTWYVDGQALAPGRTTFTPDQAREYVITCLAQDRAGNIGGATVTVKAVPVDAGVAAQVREETQTSPFEPRIVDVRTPWEVNPSEPFELQAEVAGEPHQLHTVTWLLRGIPVATGSVRGSGVVSSMLSLPNAGTYALTVRLEGTAEERVANVRVAAPKEPMIVSPDVPPGSVRIMSGPITFRAINIPEGAALMWASDVDGVLKEHVSEVTTTLSPGLHTVTLWIDDVGISMQVSVQPPVEPLQQVGTITGWTGSPAISRYDGRIIRLRPGADFSDYNAADLVVYDVDRLQLGADDTLQLRLLRDGRELRYTSSDNGKTIDSWGIPYEPGEQSE
ncbi:MAG: PKD domain-containing protein [Limnochordia bacterium]